MGDGAPSLLSTNPNHQVRRDATGHSSVSLRRLRRDARRNGSDRQRADAKAVFQKIRDEAMRLAALGVNYERVGKVWTRVAGGKVELKVARGGRGVALASAGSWEDALVAARGQGRVRA